MNLPVSKIELILPQKGMEKILDKLQSGGFIEIIPKEKREEEDSKNSDFSAALSEVNFALSFLRDFAPKEGFLRGLIYSFIPSKQRIKSSDLSDIVNSSEVKDVAQKCAEIEEKVNQLESRREELLSEIEILERFKGTSAVAKEKLDRADHFVGRINSRDKKKFLEELPKRKAFYLEEGKEDSFNFNFSLLYLRKDAEIFSKTLKRYDAREEDIFWQGTASQALEIREKELADINLEIGIQKKEAQKLLFFIPKLEALADWLSWQIEKEYFVKKGEKTSKFFGIKAWVAKSNMAKIKETIKELTDQFLIKELKISDNDNPPVIVENKGLMGSFAIVSGVYGLPKRDELDPTPYLAPFFIFYFALALSDAGYGLLLAAISYLAKKKFSKAGVDKFFNLFIFGGILTAIVGLFVGTLFGSDVLESIRIADPVADPITALVFVLILGAIQIFVGLLIGMFWLIKNGQARNGISGNGASALFFIAIVIFFITGNISFIYFGLLAMIAVATIFSQEKNIIVKISKGLGSVYGLVGYFSDILSYSRILALGLATGIIAAVINMIAVIFKDMIPIPGVDWLIAGLVLIIGHTGNLMINALGAFIHSARLQFVEYFSKFMEGGGRYFKPLAKKGRFIEIIN